MEVFFRDSKQLEFIYSPLRASGELFSPKLKVPVGGRDRETEVDTPGTQERRRRRHNRVGGDLGHRKHVDKTGGGCRGKQKRGETKERGAPGDLSIY